VPPASASPLRQRLASALVLAPVALGAAFLGRPVWDILIAVAGACMAWEWGRLCGHGRLSHAAVATVAVAPMAVIVGAIWGMPSALLILAVAVPVTAAAAMVERTASPAWLALGVAYVGLPCLTLIWIRALPGTGLVTMIWVLGLVWATDTGAYVAGRGLGGPKLAPRISPNKTWAGLIGGALAAAAVGLATAVFLSTAPNPALILLSAALALIEQIGDLFESAVKRHFGVKDSSNLIPGHGGVLDRVDGLLAVSLTVAALSWGLPHPILFEP
jgi:phosphatidate cytidylyltransferase